MGHEYSEWLPGLVSTAASPPLSLHVLGRPHLLRWAHRFLPLLLLLFLLLLLLLRLFLLLFLVGGLLRAPGYLCVTGFQATSLAGTFRNDGANGTLPVLNPAELHQLQVRLDT